eukprot:scaffold124979_cov27-Phaeocystis_antarctica.AAC.1
MSTHRAECHHIGFLPLFSTDKCTGFYSIGLRSKLRSAADQHSHRPAARLGARATAPRHSFAGASAATICSITVPMPPFSVLQRQLAPARVSTNSF